MSTSTLSPTFSWTTPDSPASSPRPTARISTPSAQPAGRTPEGCPPGCEYCDGPETD